MKRIVASIIVAGALASCGGKSAHQTPKGDGFVTISLALVPSDVTSVTATLSGGGITSPLTQTLTISGSPPTAAGTFNGVPAGSIEALVNGFPASPENTIAIYTGNASATVTAGQETSVPITLDPVTADVTVTATFPSGDIDIPNVDHTSVVVSGARVPTGVTYYLSLEEAAGTAVGTATDIPVGENRTFTVNSFDASGNLLFSGAATGTVNATGSNVVDVTLTNQAGGAVSVNVGFCAPSCGTAVCGDDGCGGSCGGCEPGATCGSGVCSGAGGPVAVPLGPYFDVVGIARDGVAFTGSLDGEDSYSGTLLGTSQVFGGTTMSLGTAGANSAIAAKGQVISLPTGQFSSLKMLGAVTAWGSGDYSVPFTVTYSDNSTHQFSQNMSSWGMSWSFANETIVAAMPYEIGTNGGQFSPMATDLYGYVFALDNTKTVVSFTLPPVQAHGNIDLFAMTLVP